jgi:hypothetical protein
MKSPQNYLIVFLAVIAIGVGIHAWRQSDELIGLRAAAQQTTDERAALQKATWDAQKQVKQLEGELTAARNQAAASATGGTGPATNQSRAVNNMAAGMASMMAMMDNPDVQRLMALQQKGALSGRYGALFKNLHLNPDQLSQFKNLLVEKQMVSTDVMIAATQQGINPMSNPKEFAELMRSTQADIDSKIKSTIGDDGYAQYQNYQQTQGQRNVINQLEQSLSYTDTPLTSTQSEQMVQILSQGSAGNATGAQIMIAGPGGGGAPAGGGPGSRITDATITSAQGVLSPPQIQALQEIQQQQQAAQQLARVMMQNQGRGSAMPMPPPGG